MANTGCFCLLMNQRRDKLYEAGVALDAWVKGHDSLKNLHFAPIPLWESGLVSGSCDRLTPRLMKEFLQAHKEMVKGCRVFVVDSTYGDDWEEVHW